MASRSRQPPPPRIIRIADRLHSATIRLLRRLRTRDAPAGLTAPRLSALSVIVHAGPLTLGELANAEQVRPPTITRLVQDLEREGFVARVVDPVDRRVSRVRATAKGKRLLREGRLRRVETLARAVERLPPDKRRLLAQATDLIEELLDGMDE